MAESAEGNSLFSEFFDDLSVADKLGQLASIVQKPALQLSKNHPGQAWLIAYSLQAGIQRGRAPISLSRTCPITPRDETARP